MVTELRGVGTGFVKAVDTFPSASPGRMDVAASSVSEQQSPANQEVLIKAVKGRLIALSDVKDVAAIAANSIREANKVLDDAGVVSNFSQSDPKASSDSQNMKASSDSQNLKASSDSRNPNASSDSQDNISTQAGNPEQTKSSARLTQEQIAYLARLNAGRAALQAQLDKLIGVLDVNLQQLASESQAQIIANSVAGQLCIALQPLVSNSNALAQLRE